MDTIVLVIHLIIALTIIGLVLLQRSTGGGLGIGGGGMGDFASARGTANTLTKLTTGFAFAFFITSLTLAWLATNRDTGSVLDALSDEKGIVIEETITAPEVPLEVEPQQAPEVPIGQ
jgi:preprotein translocase subunit SecG